MNPETPLCLRSVSRVVHPSVYGVLGHNRCLSFSSRPFPVPRPHGWDFPSESGEEVSGRIEGFEEGPWRRRLRSLRDGVPPAPPPRYPKTRVRPVVLSFWVDSRPDRWVREEHSILDDPPSHPFHGHLPLRKVIRIHEDGTPLSLCPGYAVGARGAVQG